MNKKLKNILLYGGVFLIGGIIGLAAIPVGISPIVHGALSVALPLAGGSLAAFVTKIVKEKIIDKVKEKTQNQTQQKETPEQQKGTPEQQKGTAIGKVNGVSQAPDLGASLDEGATIKVPIIGSGYAIEGKNSTYQQMNTAIFDLSTFSERHFELNGDSLEITQADEEDKRKLNKKERRELFKKIIEKIAENEEKKSGSLQERIKVEATSTEVDKATYTVIVGQFKMSGLSQEDVLKLVRGVERINMTEMILAALNNANSAKGSVGREKEV